MLKIQVLAQIVHGKRDDRFRVPFRLLVTRSIYSNNRFHAIRNREARVIVFHLASTPHLPRAVLPILNLLRLVGDQLDYRLRRSLRRGIHADHIVRSKSDINSDLRAHFLWILLAFHR